MPKEGQHVSAADIVYAQQLVVPGEFFPSPLNINTQSAELQGARWQHSGLHHADQHATIIGNHTIPKDVYGLPRVSTSGFGET